MDKSQKFIVLNRYDEIFDIEIDGWCYGVSNYPGEIHADLIHRVIKELRESFREAILHHYAFDIPSISAKVVKAAKYLIAEKEIAYSIMAQLPNPATLDGPAQQVLSSIIDTVEKKFPGAHERLSKKWHTEVQMGAGIKSAA